MKNTSLLFLFSLMFIIAGCSSDSITKTYKLENIDFTLEGPLFEGANTGQYEVEVDLAKILDDVQAIDKIKEAKLISCQFYSSDSSSFDNVSSFVVQLTADKADMTEIAVLNPVDNPTSVQLLPSEKDASIFFKQNKFIVLVDASLKKDQEENFKFKANLVFEIKVNK